MKAHLRADLIRLRGRWDLWVFALGIPTFAAVGFLQGYVDVPNHFGWDPSEPIPPSVVAAIAAERANYAFPASILTMIGSAPWLLIALFAFTSMLIGIEFDSGTIRTSLLASPDRRRFLASRLTVLAVLGMLILAGMLVLGAILPLVLALTGNTPPPSPAVAPVQALGGVIAVIVTLAFVLAFSGLLAIATRNPALPMLVGLVYFVLETFAANLGQWRELHLELLRGSLPIASVTALLADSLDPAHYGIGPPISDPSYVDRPLLLSFIVVAAWAGVFVVLADLLLRRADISE